MPSTGVWFRRQTRGAWRTTCQQFSRRTGILLTIILIGCAKSPAPVKNVAPSATHAMTAPTSTVASQSRPHKATSICFQACERAPDFRFENGGPRPLDSILETLGGGVAVLDFDRDGWLDLCFAGGGRFQQDAQSTSIIGAPLALFRNLQASDGQWNAVPREVTTKEQDLFSLGIAAADFNNDGFVDVLLTGYGACLLFQNQGDGTFAESPVGSGIDDRGFSSSAAWGDLNSDGLLDLYICHYVDWSPAADQLCRSKRAHAADICGPKTFPAESDRIYLNAGNGSFENASTKLGLQPGGKGLGVVMGDFDRDGDLDIYVANDTTANFLYLNDGHGQFQEVAALHGVAYDENGRPTGSMGVATADYDGDGELDLLTTNFEYEAVALFRNMRHAQFHAVSRPAGLAAIYGEYVGWGTAFADFDADGDLDLVVANGHLPDYVPTDRLPQLPFLLTYDAPRFGWAKTVDGDYFSKPHTGRGLAVADFNRDGMLDLVVSHLNEKPDVLLNKTPTNRTVVEAAFLGRDSNRDGIGVIAVLETSSGKYLRHMAGGGSYLSTSERLLHWAVPTDSLGMQLAVRWPSGKTQVIKLVESPSLQQISVVEP